MPKKGETRPTSYKVINMRKKATDVLKPDRDSRSFRGKPGSTYGTKYGDDGDAKPIEHEQLNPIQPISVCNSVRAVLSRSATIPGRKLDVERTEEAFSISARRPTILNRNWLGIPSKYNANAENQRTSLLTNKREKD